MHTIKGALDKYNIYLSISNCHSVRVFPTELNFLEFDVKKLQFRKVGRYPC